MEISSSAPADDDCYGLGRVVDYGNDDDDANDWEDVSDDDDDDDEYLPVFDETRTTTYSMQDLSSLGEEFDVSTISYEEKTSDEQCTYI